MMMKIFHPDDSSHLHYLRSSMLEEGGGFEMNSLDEERTLKLNGKE